MEFNNNKDYWIKRYNQMDTKQVVGRKDWTNKKYNNEFIKWEKYLHKILIKNNIIDNINNVLELGCGIGRWVSSFQKSIKIYYTTNNIINYIIKSIASNYYGCDIIEYALDKARELNKSKYCHFELIKNNTIPFNDKKFDLVFTCVCLQHIIDDNLLNHYMNQIYNRLNDNKYILIIENITKTKSNDYIKFRTKENYETILKENKFEIIDFLIFESSNEPHILILGKNYKKI